MDALSHIFFAHLITSTRFSWGLVIGSLIPDLDKVYTFLIKKKFRKVESRTRFQELPFLSLLSGMFMILGLFEIVQGILLHFLLDFVTGETRPFSPLSDKIIDFNLSIPKKIVLGGLIWALYLASLML